MIEGINKLVSLILDHDSFFYAFKINVNSNMLTYGLRIYFTQNMK